MDQILNNAVVAELGKHLELCFAQRRKRFAGTNVPQDFVEAPSQMLEYFTWDKKVLDSFAADYRDSSKKIPPEILDQLRAADLATKGGSYRRQLSFGILDLVLHSGLTTDQLNNLDAYSNKILGDVFLPPDPGTAMIQLQPANIRPRIRSNEQRIVFMLHLL